VFSQDSKKLKYVSFNRLGMITEKIEAFEHRLNLWIGKTVPFQVRISSERHGFKEVVYDLHKYCKREGVAKPPSNDVYEVSAVVTIDGKNKEALYIGPGSLKRLREVYQKRYRLGEELTEGVISHEDSHAETPKLEPNLKERVIRRFKPDYAQDIVTMRKNAEEGLANLRMLNDYDGDPVDILIMYTLSQFVFWKDGRKYSNPELIEDVVAMSFPWLRDDLQREVRSKTYDYLRELKYA